MSLNPDFPVVEGHYQLTPDWAITLDAPYNRRIEDGDLVLWNPRITIWMTIWHNDEHASIQARLDDLKQHMSPDAEGIEQQESESTLFYAYRLAEEGDKDPEDERMPGYYCYAFADNSHVQMAVYFDDEADVAIARALHHSLAYTAGDASED